MGKGGTVRANLRVTRAQINNARSSAQARAFKARQIAKQKRDADERKLRALQAAAAKEAKEGESAAERTPAAPGESPGGATDPSASED